MQWSDNQSLVSSDLAISRSKISTKVLLRVRQWLDDLKIQNCTLAKLLANLIPGQCPFERDIIIFGRVVAHIPPLCQLNPLYEQLVGLRFRAMCCLADECSER